VDTQKASCNKAGYIVYW